MRILRATARTRGRQARGLNSAVSCPFAVRVTARPFWIKNRPRLGLITYIRSDPKGGAGPVSWSAFRTFTDPDAYHASFRDRRAESVITGRGDFRADSLTVQLERLSLQDAKESLPRTAYCAVDPRQFVISFPTHPRQGIHVLNGLELVPDTIAVFRAASEGHNRFVSASRWGFVALRTRMLRLRGRP